jgi:1-acyl-sn-glycerol-3-phosphate acyltransferase
MSHMIKILRSFVFDFIFYTFTAVYLAAFSPLMLISRSFTLKLYRIWTKIVLFMLKICVGLSYSIEGKNALKEALKNGPCIIACKHQSAWETIVFSILLDDFQIVLKRQLLYVPFFGAYLKKLNAIVIDRDAGSQAIKDLLRQGREAINQKRCILIFPEGTRGQPGQPSTYQPGITALYRDLNVPVVPVALNAGVFWGRRSPIKKPGKITLRFLEAIPAGLERSEFMKLLQDKIESACSELPLSV